MCMSYASLHNHTEQSNLKLIDSINKVEELVQYGFELGLTALAITDHDTVSGHIRAWNYYNKAFSDEQKEKYKLILGNEIYLCRSDLTEETHKKGEKFYHLILIALDDIGHEQIRQISSRAWTRGYVRAIMRTPTFSEDLWEIIGENPGHVVASTACLGGYCGSMFSIGEYEAIDRHLQGMQELFGKDNFFIELQPSTQEDQILYNNYMIEHYWDKYPFIMTTDSHYLKLADRKIHKIFLNSKSSGDREVDSFYSSAYLMSYEEICSYFVGQGLSLEIIEEMRDNTNKIAARVQGYNLARTSVIPKIVYEEEALNPFYRTVVNKYPEETSYIQQVIVNGNKADIHLLNMLVSPWHEKIAAEREREYVIELDYEFEQLFKIGQALKQSMSDYFITMAKMIDIMWEDANSIVGPARGSAASSLINYLLGITQIDPLSQPVKLPFWRFIHSDRPGLPDIDIDTEASKRVAVFNKVQDYFRNIGGDLIHVCAFGTEKAKGAINAAIKGLEINEDVGSYLTAMIPNNRGFDWTLRQCYLGDDEHKPIQAFVEEINKYPMLWEVASKIEGLVTSLTCHASGVLALNEPVWRSNSVMKTSAGVLVTAFDLGDSEQMSGVKYDYLTVEALDKIRVCMNWMLEDGAMEWQGSLRKTYQKYLDPKVLNYDNKGMWDALFNKEIPSCFQFDTAVGGQAVQLIHPTNLLELLTINSILRLMAEDGKEQPLNIYAAYRRDIGLWYEEMTQAGLTLKEQRILEKYLLPVYGVAGSQELMMMMSMDEEIAGFSIAEANILRKGVAKKKREVLEQGRQLFYNKGLERGTSLQLLDYVWNVQILRQAGYSFSDIHTTAYSYIALQEMNLFYFYPNIYWKTACLSVDAGAINDEDFYNLVETGTLELIDDDDKRKQTKVRYGKMATAIIKFRQTGEVALPDINNSRFGFTPDVENNTVRFGLRGISKIGENVIHDIIINQPYASLDDFVQRMVASDGKKLISKDKVINLIKAGAFNRIEGKSTEEILYSFIQSIADTKKRLTLQNFQMLVNKGLIPPELDFCVKVYNFTKYIRKQRFMSNYILDEANGLRFYGQHFDMSKVKQVEKDGVIVSVISEKLWDATYDSIMDKARAYIKANHDELLAKLNKILFDEEYEKYASGDPSQWELDSLSFYYNTHPLANTVLPIETVPLSSLVENEFDGFWMIKGRSVPKYKLRTIMGTVIDKDKIKGLVTIQTKEHDVVDIKVFKQQFARYTHIVSSEEDGEKDVLEDSFFKKGVHLAVTGIYRGNVFVPKTYKETGFDPILRIILNDAGEVDYLLRKSE